VLAILYNNFDILNHFRSVHSVTDGRTDIIAIACSIFHEIVAVWGIYLK